MLCHDHRGRSDTSVELERPAEAREDEFGRIVERLAGAIRMTRRARATQRVLQRETESMERVEPWLGARFIERSTEYEVRG